MKSLLALALAFASLALPALVFSQNARPLRVRDIPQTPGIPQASPQQEEAAPAAPAENISISLTGALATDLPIEVTLTGCGNEFLCDVMMGNKKIDENEVPIIGSLSFIVRKQGDDYLIHYSIEARIPTPTSTSGGGEGAPKRTSISFQATTLNGEAKCVLDKEVNVFKSGAQVLALKVTRP
jgi:hypothetical protein